MALVKAAKVMTMDAIPTQTPVRDAGELSSTRIRPARPGRRDHPPPEEDGGSPSLVSFGGS